MGLTACHGGKSFSNKKCEKRAGAGERQAVATVPFPESCASYFRFTRFNTFPLNYLRAWHRLSISLIPFLWRTSFPPLPFKQSRRVSCRHFLVTPMSPKMACWPWLFLVNLGTSYGSINCARFATRESAGWIENRTIVKAPKTRNILIPKSMGKDWYVIFPSSSLSPHNGAIGKRPKNDKLRLQKAF